MKSGTTEQRANGIGRRGFMRKIGVGVGTTAAIGTGAIRLDHGPVQNSQAIAPAVAAGVVGGSAAVGWAVREFELVGRDSPTEGLTEDALRNEIYNAAKMAKSENASTFIDNRNIIENVHHAAFADAKIAAIEQINDEESQQEVQNAAETAANDYLSTIEENLLKSVNENIEQLWAFANTVEEHPDISQHDVFTGIYAGAQEPRELLQDGSYTHELADGTEFEVHEPRQKRDEGDYGRYRLTSDDRYWSNNVVEVHGRDDQYLEYLDRDDWLPVWEDLQDVIENLQDQITIWVDNVYSEVQSGEIDPEELLTPREQAELMADEEDFPQAIADLQALNVSIDLEREAEIYFSDVDATVYGQLAYTGDTTLSTGTFDPDATDEDDEPIYPGTFYLTYDISQGSGEWDAYKDGIDGGELTFTSEPFQETLFIVDTASDETVEVETDDFDHDEEADEWKVDLSNDLETSITNVEQIQFFSVVEDTQYETIQLLDQFEIITFTDGSGEEYDESNFERPETHDDENYITLDEWEAQQESYQELIEKYEDAQGSAGILPDFDNIGDIPAEYIAAAAAVVGGAALFGNSG